MFRTRRFTFIVAVLVGGLALTGCDDDDNDPTVQSGVFVDAPVAGIGYRTATQSGVTDAEGNYNFLPGEQVTFFIGDLVFPPVTAKGVVTPVDIAQEADGNATIDSAVATNIARLLQSLDDDDDPSNGIVIPASLSPANSIDFTAADAAFEAAFTAEFPTETVVTVTAARAHLQSEIDALNNDSGGDNGGNNGGGTSTQVCPFGGDATAVATLPAALASQVIDTTAATSNTGSPFTLDQAVNFTFSGSGLLFIDNVEVANAQPYQCPASAAEYLWYDEANTTIYAVAVIDDAFHEITVLNDSGTFLASLEAAADDSGAGAVANLSLVTGLAGTYDVARTGGGSHTRGTIEITSSGDIDFDTDRFFTLQQIVEIFDRTNISDAPRIQINYGDDDDGEVIQILLTPGDLSQIESIQYRHRAQNIEITSTLVTPTFSIGGSIDNSGGFSGQWELFVDSLLVNDGSLSTNSAVTFSLTDGVANGAAYVITVSNNECAVTNGSGTVSGAAIDNVEINCASQQQAGFSIGGSISNPDSLSGQWELRVGGSFVNDGSLATNSDVTFTASDVADGLAYELIVSNSACAVTNGTGTLSGASIDTVAIDCSSSAGGGSSEAPFTIAFAGPSLNADSCDPSQLTTFTGDTLLGQFNADVYSWNGDSDEPGAFMELFLDKPNAGEYEVRFVCENLSHQWTAAGSESDAGISIDRTAKVVTFNNLELTPTFNSLLQVDFQNNPTPVPASELALTLNGSLAD